MDTPADLTLKVTLPPSSGKGAAIWISVMPGYQSGQRPASLSAAIVASGVALIFTLRCTVAISGPTIQAARSAGRAVATPFSRPDAGASGVASLHQARLRVSSHWGQRTGI